MGGCAGSSLKPAAGATLAHGPQHSTESAAPGPAQGSVAAIRAGARNRRAAACASCCLQASMTAFGAAFGSVAQRSSRAAQSASDWARFRSRRCQWRSEQQQDGQKPEGLHAAASPGCRCSAACPRCISCRPSWTAVILSTPDCAADHSFRCRSVIRITFSIIRRLPVQLRNCAPCRDSRRRGRTRRSRRSNRCPCVPSCRAAPSSAAHRRGTRAGSPG